MRHDLRDQRAAVTKENMRASGVCSGPVANVLGKGIAQKYRVGSGLEEESGRCRSGKGNRK